MKKNVCMMAMLLMMAVGVNAQDNNNPAPKPPTQEEMMAMDVQRASERLMLDEATAAKFEPIYRKYLQEKMALRPQPKEQPQAQQGMPKTPTDAEMDKAMQDRWDQQTKEIELERKYYSEFRKVLSPRQCQMVMQDHGHRGGKHGDMRGMQPGKPGPQMGHQGPSRNHGNQGRRF